MIHTSILQRIVLVARLPNSVGDVDLFLAYQPSLAKREEMLAIDGPLPVRVNFFALVLLSASHTRCKKYRSLLPFARTR